MEGSEGGNWIGACKRGLAVNWLSRFLANIQCYTVIGKFAADDVGFFGEI